MRIINRGKNLGKRVIAGMLIMSMAFGMSGCGGGSKGTAAESTAAEAQTTGSVSDAGEDSDVKNMTFGCEEGFFGDHSGHIMSAIKVGDYIAYLTSDDTATEGEAEMMWKYNIYLKSIQDGTEKLIYETLIDSRVENLIEANGNIAFIEGGGVGRTLRIIDIEGNDVSTIELSGLNNSAKDKYIYDVSFTPDGEIAANTDTELIILKKDGTESKVVPYSSFGIGSVVTKDGKLLAVSDGGAGYIEAVEIDPKTGVQGEKYKLNTENIDSNGIQTGFGEYDFFYDGKDGIYGYKLADKSEKKICDYNSSRIDGTSMRGILMCDNELFIETDGDDMGNITSVDAYRKTDPSEVKEVTVLKYASMDYSLATEQNIAAFNRTHPDVRIEMMEYAEMDNPFEKLSADIAAGNVPDIFDTSYGIGELSVEQAVDRGLLEDLTPYIENDPDISEDDFLDKIIEYSKVDGKLYYLTPNFELDVIVTKKSMIGDRTGWTYDEMMDYIRSYPDDIQILCNNQKTAILSFLLFGGAGKFIDEDNRTCNFNSPEFKEVLEMANKGSNESTYMWDDDSYIEKARNNQLLFINTNTSPVNWMVYDTIFQGDAYCIGYPSEDRNGVDVTLRGAVGMSTACKDKETAWEFIKFCTSKEQEGKNYADFAGIPTRKDIFEMYMKAMKTTEDYTDEFGNTIFPQRGSIEWFGLKTDTRPITDEEEEAFRDAIDRISHGDTFDDNIFRIVVEESQAYFAGGKNTDEVAENIQNRVSTYLKETE